jgi:para-aminobenzoate synthetase/4-amino-4-deoxychorismate lyase
VRGPALLTVERHPTVLQLTSDITARLRPGTGLAELFTALFPCGSITGAPKTSMMKLIAELEDTPRGGYWRCHRLDRAPTEQVGARFGAIRTAVVDTPQGGSICAGHGPVKRSQIATLDAWHERTVFVHVEGVRV